MRGLRASRTWLRSPFFDLINSVRTPFESTKPIAVIRSIHSSTFFCSSACWSAGVAVVVAVVGGGWNIGVNIVWSWSSKLPNDGPAAAAAAPVAAEPDVASDVGGALDLGSVLVLLLAVASSVFPWFQLVWLFVDYQRNNRNQYQMVRELHEEIYQHFQGEYFDQQAYLLVHRF